MRETKLYSTIVQLDGFELNRLHRFILSPYFNRNESIIRLFEWIKEDLKSQKEVVGSREELWNLCFGNSDPYNDGRFRKLQSDLLRLIEEYYAQESFEANPIHKAKYLLESIFENKLEHLKLGALKTAQRFTENQKLKPASFYYYQYEIEQSKYDLSKSQAERSEKSNIEDIAQNLDRFYLAEKLRYYCTILNHQLLAALNYKILFMDEIIEHVTNYDYSDVPPIRIYYQILLTYKEPENEIHFENLKKLIDQYIQLFSETEAKEIIDAVINYSLKRMNAGEKEYIRETFNLYVKFLSNELLLVNGQITPWSYSKIS
jgi:hypothetical protein